MLNSVTWEDVEAVCKVMGVEYLRDNSFGEFVVYRRGSRCGGAFDNPEDALEYLTAPRHELEKP